jgi:hypothetical protein
MRLSGNNGADSGNIGMLMVDTKNSRGFRNARNARNARKAKPKG